LVSLPILKDKSDKQVHEPEVTNDETLAVVICL